MKTLRTKVFHLNTMGWHSQPENQNLICDDMPFIARTEWERHFFYKQLCISEIAIDFALLTTCILWVTATTLAALTLLSWVIYRGDL